MLSNRPINNIHIQWTNTGIITKIPVYAYIFVHTCVLTQKIPLILNSDSYELYQIQELSKIILSHIIFFPMGYAMYVICMHNSLNKWIRPAEPQTQTHTNTHANTNTNRQKQIDTSSTHAHTYTYTYKYA